LAVFSAGSSVEILTRSSDRAAVFSLLPRKILSIIPLPSKDEPL
jgi:hypothetical protein